jgi:hypothetical protein
MEADGSVGLQTNPGEHGAAPGTSQRFGLQTPLTQELVLLQPFAAQSDKQMRPPHAIVSHTPPSPHAVLSVHSGGGALHGCCGNVVSHAMYPPG